jgi:hypothetical protein
VNNTKASSFFAAAFTCRPILLPSSHPTWVAQWLRLPQKCRTAPFRSLMLLTLAALLDTRVPPLLATSRKFLPSSSFGSHFEEEARSESAEFSSAEDRSKPTRRSARVTGGGGGGGGGSSGFTMPGAHPSTPPKPARSIPSHAPPTIRQYIELARKLARERPAAPDDPPASPFDPKSDQVHARANASNLPWRRARQIIARSSSKYPCISAALLRTCGACDIPKPNLSDFAPSAVVEAARAVMHQESILAALLASAIAESASHGFAGKYAVEQLSETFDQGGKDMIDLGHVTCDMSPLAISLGVYPLGQLALAIYTKHHAPSHAGGRSCRAMEVTFTHDGVFNPQLALKQWNNVYHEALVIRSEYNIAAVVTHITRAMNAVRTEQLRLRVEDGARQAVPTTWSEFVYATVDKAATRLIHHAPPSSSPTPPPIRRTTSPNS